MTICPLTKETAPQLKTVSNLNVKPDKLELFINDENCLAYVALDKERVVGFAYGYVLQRLDDNSMIYIHSVDVIESYRRKGIGKQLIQAFLDEMKKRRFLRVFLITDHDNIPANELYSSLPHKREKNKVLYVFTL